MVYSCETCKDKGAVIDHIDDNGLAIYKRCLCATEKLFKNKLGLALFAATKLRDPVTGAPKTSGLVEFVDKNVFLWGSVEAFYAHLRSVIINYGLNFYYQLVSDKQLLDVYLGKDPDVESIRHYLGPKLLVLQLGGNGYKNVALPGIVTEMVQSRLFENKPIWVFNTKALASDDLCYSETLVQIIEDYFQTIAIGKASKTASVKQVAATNFDVEQPKQSKSASKTANDIAADIAKNLK